MAQATLATQHLVSVVIPFSRLGGLSRRGCRRRLVRTHQARQIRGERGGDDFGRCAGQCELAIARIRPQLRLPGNVADRHGTLLPNEPQCAIDPGQETVTPSRLDREPASGAIQRPIDQQTTVHRLPCRHDPGQRWDL